MDDILDYLGDTADADLEWAVRQYSVAVDYLLAAFEKHEDMNARIAAALTNLTSAINEEWS